MPTRITRALAVALRAGAALLGIAIPCCATYANPIFYGVTSASNLVRFDMGAQTATVVAPLTVGVSPLTVMEDCDFDAAGNLWGMRQGNLGGFPPTTVCQAYRIDIATGSAVLTGNFGNSASLQSLAFRGSNSSFYSVNAVGPTSAGHLGFAGMTTGIFASSNGVPLGLPGSFTVDSLAFNPLTGDLYGIKDTNAGGPFGTPTWSLFRVNLATGLGTVIGTVGSNPMAFPCLRFDDAGIAYTVDSNSGNVFTVDITNGQRTLLFAGGAAAVGTRGLGFIPTPGAAALLGLGGLVAARRRRA